jgi:hypothetical protein
VAALIAVWPFIFVAPVLSGPQCDRFIGWFDRQFS